MTAPIASGHTVHVDGRSPRADRRVCRRVSRSCCHERVGHRRRRLHRLAFERAAAGAGRGSRRHRLLHRLLSTRDQRTESVAASRAAAAIASSKLDLQTRSAALLDGVTHVFHLAAQAGVRKSWGRDFRSTRRSTSTRRSGCWRRASAGRSSGSSMRRARRSTAMTSRFRCARTRCSSRCRRTASPSSRPSTCATCTTSTTGADGLAALFHRLWPSPAAGHGIQPLLHRRARRSAAHAIRRRPANPRLHLCGGCRRRRRPPRPSGECPGASTILEAVLASRCGRCST